MTTTSLQGGEIWRVDDERFLDHLPPGDHAERPERYAAVREGYRRAEASGVRFRDLTFEAAGDELLLLGHTPEHLERVAEAVRFGAFLDEDTYTSPRSEEVARLAVGASVALCAALLEAPGAGPRFGFAGLRPPGHHAERDRAMGFCLYSNVALAALEMRRRGLVERVAIVDWDVHHGNGTEHVLWEEPGLLFVSLHQHPLYPGTGAVNDLGAGDGLGWTANLPVPAGSHDGDLLTLFDRVVVPLLEAVDPDLVIISAGYDAHSRDPLAGLELSGKGFGWMTQRLVGLGKPIAAVLEGGYSPIGLAEGVAATLEGFGGSFPAGEPPAGSERVRSVAAASRSLLASYWPTLG